MLTNGPETKSEASPAPDRQDSLRPLAENREWQALLTRGRERNRKADELAAIGKPVRFRDPVSGNMYLAGADTYPGGLGFRLTTFLADGSPFGHFECHSLREAIYEGLGGHHEVVNSVSANTIKKQDRKPWARPKGAEEALRKMAALSRTGTPLTRLYFSAGVLRWMEAEALIETHPKPGPFGTDIGPVTPTEKGRAEMARAAA